VFVDCQTQEEPPRWFLKQRQRLLQRWSDLISSQSIGIRKKYDPWRWTKRELYTGSAENQKDGPLFGFILLYFLKRQCAH
jgi:hypothetical protein